MNKLSIAFTFCMLLTINTTSCWDLLGLYEITEKFEKILDNKIEKLEQIKIEMADDFKSILDKTVHESDKKLEKNLKELDKNLSNTVKTTALCCCAGYLATLSGRQLYHSSSNLLYKLYVHFKKTDSKTINENPLHAWDFIDPIFTAACCAGCIGTIVYSNSIINYFAVKQAA